MFVKREASISYNTRHFLSSAILISTPLLVQ